MQSKVYKDKKLNKSCITTESFGTVSNDVLLNDARLSLAKLKNEIFRFTFENPRSFLLLVERRVNRDPAEGKK